MKTIAERMSDQLMQELLQGSTIIHSRIGETRGMVTIKRKIPVKDDETSEHDAREFWFATYEYDDRFLDMFWLATQFTKDRIPSIIKRARKHFMN